VACGVTLQERDLYTDHIWDLPTKRQSLFLTGHLGGALDVAVDATGDVLTSVSTWLGGLWLWHPRIGRVMLAMLGAGLRFRRGTPVGRMFASEAGGPADEAYPASRRL